VNTLKPTALKIIFAFGLFVITGYFWKFSGITDIHPFGLPFFAIVTTQNCGFGIDACTEFRWGGLLADLLIWYVVSAFAVDRIARRKR